MSGRRDVERWRRTPPPTPPPLLQPLDSVYTPFHVYGSVVRHSSYVLSSVVFSGNRIVCDDVYGRHTEYEYELMVVCSLWVVVFAFKSPSARSLALVFSRELWLLTVKKMKLGIKWHNKYMANICKSGSQLQISHNSHCSNHDFNIQKLQDQVCALACESAATLFHVSLERLKLKQTEFLIIIISLRGKRVFHDWWYMQIPPLTVLIDQLDVPMLPIVCQSSLIQCNSYAGNPVFIDL